MKFIYRFFPLLLITNIFAQIDYSIIQSDEQKLILDFNVNLISEDNLKPISIVIGIPNNEYPELVIEYGNNAKKYPKTGKHQNLLVSNGLIFNVCRT